MTREQALHHVASRRPDLRVAACALARHQRAYVLDGLRRTAACEFFDSLDAVELALDGGYACDAMVVAPLDATLRSAVPLIERVVRDWPSTAVVVFFPPRVEVAPAPRAFALAGAHQFVFEGVNNTALTLASAVASARKGCAADVVCAALFPDIPSDLHSLARAVTSRPDSLTSVEAVASVLGVHRKTLVNRCARHQFLAPAEFIMWCRLAMVGYFLQMTGSTIESISNTLGFASHTALRNLVKRYTGLRGTDIRRGGGLELVVGAFRARLTALRRATPEGGSAGGLPVA